jgi:hypothetical protein
VIRAPLGPLPPGSYDRDLPTYFSPSPDLLTYRGNFCGIRVKDAPGVPGGMNATVPGGDTSLMMAAHLDRYPLEIQQEYLQQYGSYGYSHLQQSLGHSMEAGRSIDQVVETLGMIGSRGLFRDIWFLGGGPLGNVANAHPENRDRDAAYWKPILDPWIDALLANRAIDCACVGWQLDQFNKESDSRTGEGPLQSIIDYLADRLGPHGIPIGTHWVNEAGAWNTPMDRFAWWKRQRNRLSWFHQQGPTDTPIADYQAKIKDVLDPFGDGRMGTSGLFGDRPFGCVLYECSAQAQYDGLMTEGEGDLRSTLILCTKAAGQFAGYGNGGRGFDGGWL